MLHQIARVPLRLFKKTARLFSPRRHRSQRYRGDRLVFVGGAPRSGTTLVQHILDSHPDVFGGPEFDCVPMIVNTWRHVRHSLDTGRIREFCTSDQIDRSFAALIEHLLLPAAAVHRARLVSEKTPLNVLVLKELLQILPKCRGVYVVRDPRAVVASMLQVGVRSRAKNLPAPEFTLDLQAAIAFTRQCLDAGFEAQRAFADRVRTVVYETLVAEPAAAVPAICDFLNIPFDPRMLQPHANVHPGMEQVLRLDNGTWTDPNLPFRPIERSRVDSWRTTLDADQIDRVNQAFRDHAGLGSLGYSF